jgi:hypothetical protein
VLRLQKMLVGLFESLPTWGQPETAALRTCASSDHVISPSTRSWQVLPMKNLKKIKDDEEEPLVGLYILPKFQGMRPIYCDMWGPSRDLA